VINMSLGGAGSNTTEGNAMQAAYDANVLLIAAAGNDGNTALSYPASYDSVVSVAAVDDSKAHADFSQRNSQVELAGPGVAVLSA
ncbi:S8 family serine peptidase, partial [Bacillus sp. SIMBA_074]|uniref:S8 family serine peptidase n=1 Tax=Bacillus sp. SIMBA_074 TaxID=3085812 RepID=UPI00397D6D64